MKKLILAGLAALFALSATPAPAQDNSPPKRAAILVGTKQYRPDGYVPSPDGPLMLRNLVTPCAGVDAISAKLQLLGWTYDDTDPESEIHQFCDTNPAIVEAFIQEKVAEFDRPNDLLIIYLAAHGAEVANRNYVFGPNAKIDLKYEADRLHTYNDNLLFVGKAFDLESAVFRPAGVLYRGNVLVILDTCRDDPVSFSEFARVLGTPAGGPQVVQRARGVVIYYATAPGKRVSDGNGLSNMAQHLSDALVSGKRVDQITAAVTSKIMDDTAASGNMETPIPSGQFNNPDLCFAGCAIADRSTRQSTKLAQNSVRQPAPTATDVVEQVKTPPPAASPRFNYLRGFIQALQTSTLDVEIFWCKTETVPNEAKAQDLANRLLGQSAVRTKARAVVPGAVRYRELTPEENANAGLQVSDDRIRINFDSEEEASFAERIRQTSSFPLHIERSRVNSLDSVAVYLCDGAPKYERASKLIVQAASDDQKGLAAALSETVAETFPGMTATAVDARPKTQENSPDTTQVRFFHEADKEKAEDAAALIETMTGQKVLPVFLPQYASGAADGDIELWVGRSLDTTLAAKALAQYYSSKD